METLTAALFGVLFIFAIVLFFMVLNAKNKPNSGQPEPELAEATADTLGVVRLSGALGGTANSPQIASNAIGLNNIVGLAKSQTLLGSGETGTDISELALPPDEFIVDNTIQRRRKTYWYGNDLGHYTYLVEFETIMPTPGTVQKFADMRVATVQFAPSNNSEGQYIITNNTSTLASIKVSVFAKLSREGIRTYLYNLDTGEEMTEQFLPDTVNVYVIDVMAGDYIRFDIRMRGGQNITVEGFSVQLEEI
jgi:hypothetical protein